MQYVGRIESLSRCGRKSSSTTTAAVVGAQSVGKQPTYPYFVRETNQRALTNIKYFRPRLHSPRARLAGCRRRSASKTSEACMLSDPATPRARSTLRGLAQPKTNKTTRLRAPPCASVPGGTDAAVLALTVFPHKVEPDQERRLASKPESASNVQPR